MDVRRTKERGQELMRTASWRRPSLKKRVLDQARSNQSIPVRSSTEVRWSNRCWTQNSILYTSAKSWPLKRPDKREDWSREKDDRGQDWLDGIVNLRWTSFGADRRWTGAWCRGHGSRSSRTRPTSTIETGPCYVDALSLQRIWPPRASMSPDRLLPFPSLRGSRLRIKL